MKFDVYCDECYPDVLSSENPPVQFMAIGSLWFPSEFRDRYKQKIHELRDHHRIGPEFKWSKISPSKEAFYLDLVRWYLSEGDDLRFRCILVDHKQVNLEQYHDGDQELGFYKFYYQLLHHWINECNEYAVFCDFKSNRLGNRLPMLQTCLQNANLFANVSNVQSVRSEESVLIQLVDVFSGAVAAKMNDRLSAGSAKWHVVEELERGICHPIQATSRTEQKFNVFQINLAGGWQA